MFDYSSHRWAFRRLDQRASVFIVGYSAAWTKERVFLSLGIPPPELKSGCKSNQQNAGKTRHFVLHIALFQIKNT